MGVFQTPVDIAGMAREMREAVKLWQTGFVQIILPRIGEVTYVDGELTVPDQTVLWQGPARIQAVRSALNADQGFKYTKITGIRFQVPLDNDAGLIRAGMQVRVLDGGEDKSLERLQYTVATAVNSTMAWVRTIEAETDLGSDNGEPVTTGIDANPGEFIFPAPTDFPEG